MAFILLRYTVYNFKYNQCHVHTSTYEGFVVKIKKKSNGSAINIQHSPITVVRAFAHGEMGRRIDPSWLTHWAISHFSQCSTTGVTKAVVCVIMFVGCCI